MLYAVGYNTHDVPAQYKINDAWKSKHFQPCLRRVNIEELRKVVGNGYSTPSCGTLHQTL